jgi:hypothetical protein
MIPKTRRYGQAIAMLRELEQANWSRNMPGKSAKIVDARIRDCLQWPAQARRGFTGIVAVWLRDRSARPQLQSEPLAGSDSASVAHWARANR